MKITTERLKEIIKEEIEVTLTNEEAAEMFGDEVLEELDEGIENLTPDNLQMAATAFIEVAKTFSPAVVVPAILAMLKQFKGQARGEEDVQEALGADQEGMLHTRILPALMDAAGQNVAVALEMVETLKAQLAATPEEGEEPAAPGL